MDEANSRPVQGSSNPPDDWRAQISPEARGRIANKLAEDLKKHHPLATPLMLDVLQRAAVLLEDKIYSTVTNLADYLRELSLNMLSMKTKRQRAPRNAQVIPNQNNLGQG